MSFSSNNPQITNQLPITINLPSLEDQREFIGYLEILLRNISNTVNSKTGGLNTLNETVTGDQYYTEDNPQSFRNVYRKTFDLVNLNGADIPPGALGAIAHNIDGVIESAGIYAHRTAITGEIFTLVYPDIYIDSTSIFFNNPFGVQLTQADIVCNYLKN